MTTPTKTPKLGFRPDLEGLRAVAVLLVVLYHAHLPLLTGGYVGVDVFYVLSGFFITGLLVKEVTATGRVSLRQFYARRGRRLLPIATLVIITTTIAAWLVYPPLRLPAIGWDALTSAFNVANFRYAAQSTDYLASTQDPSPFLHFWSLAVEEQFYWVWPLLIAGIAGALFRPLARQVPRARLVVVLGVITVASFAASVWLTGANQPWAFFMLPTRAWELAAGALIAVAGTQVDRIARRARIMFGYAGVALIVVTACLLNDQTAFPGWAALLPVSGTVLVLLSVLSPGSASSVLSAAPLRALGRWSYSIYLWHWPLLVIPAVIAGTSLSLGARLSLVAASIVLGAVSYRMVENPIRVNTTLAASVRKSLALSGTLVATGALLGASLVVLPGILANSGGGAAVAEPSQGSSALPSESATIQPVPSNLTPSLADAAANLPASYSDGCHLDFTGTSFGTCVYGDPSGTKTVVLIGDSHAAQWLPALTSLGKTNGWKIISLTKSSCEATTAMKAHPSDKGRDYTECALAHQAALARVTAAKPDLVVLASMTSALAGQDPTVQAAWYTGMTEFASQVTRAGAAHVLVLGDTPHPGRNVPDCLSAHLGDATVCSPKVSAAVSSANEAKTKAAAQAGGASYAQTSGWLCTTVRCPVIVGNLLAYRDDSHLTTQMSTWLAPHLEAAVEAALN